MPTSRHREYADDYERDPAVRLAVVEAARVYADALARAEEARLALLAAEEAER